MRSQISSPFKIKSTCDIIQVARGESPPFWVDKDEMPELSLCLGPLHIPLKQPVALGLSEPRAELLRIWATRPHPRGAGGSPPPRGAAELRAPEKPAEAVLSCRHPATCLQHGSDALPGPSVTTESQSSPRWKGPVRMRVQLLLGALPALLWLLGPAPQQNPYPCRAAPIPQTNTDTENQMRFLTVLCPSPEKQRLKREAGSALLLE